MGRFTQKLRKFMTMSRPSSSNSNININEMPRNKDSAPPSALKKFDP